MSLRLLAIGDIHLGRRPAGLPEDVVAQAGGADAVGPRGAWRAAVQAAIDREVDVVALLGDVVDDEGHYLEGWSELETGLRRLEAAGIAVVAVAGNHDVVVLPRLAEAMSGLVLLGRGGRWERHRIERPGGVLDFVGWSFPDAHVGTDPGADPRLAELCAEAAAAPGPTIGMLHGDLDVKASRYAPLSRARLLASGATAWLLGHVHKPSFPAFPAAGGDVATAGAGAPGAAAVPIGYLGSLVGLDPSETGTHGPWLLAFDGARVASAEQLALAPLSWDTLAIDAGELAGVDGLAPALAQAARDAAAGRAGSLGSARVLGLRVRLVGRCEGHAALHEAARSLDLSALRPVFDGRTLFVESLQDAARPALDLDALAREDDPPGLLARRLLALEGNGNEEERSRLLSLARRRTSDLALRGGFPELPATVARPDDATLAAALLDAGLAALEALLAARPAPAGGGR